MREKDGRYYAATGSKGYRWFEAEMVKTLKKEQDIDRSYYDKLVDKAVKSISKYGDFEWFVSEDPYIKDEGPKDDWPPWAMPCETVNIQRVLTARISTTTSSTWTVGLVMIFQILW